MFRKHLLLFILLFSINAVFAAEINTTIKIEDKSENVEHLILLNRGIYNVTLKMHRELAPLGVLLPFKMKEYLPNNITVKSPNANLLSYKLIRNDSSVRIQIVTLDDDVIIKISYKVKVKNRWIVHPHLHDIEIRKYDGGKINITKNLIIITDKELSFSSRDFKKIDSKIIFENIKEQPIIEIFSFRTYIPFMYYPILLFIAVLLLFYKGVVKVPIKRASISGLTINKPEFYPDEIINVAVTVKNRGNVDLPLTLEMSIIASDGEIKSHITKEIFLHINEERLEVFKQKITPTFRGGEYVVKVMIKRGKKVLDEASKIFKLREIFKVEVAVMSFKERYFLNQYSLFIIGVRNKGNCPLKGKLRIKLQKYEKKWENYEIISEENIFIKEGKATKIEKEWITNSLGEFRVVAEVLRNGEIVARSASKSFLVYQPKGLRSSVFV